ncbi:MAG: sigma-70 family RNA polymerase sigma factor [Salinisphaeraceae bacterium]|nr:sigma-70 family RNA polymerase sigma factor [Salinisphaeraceae bacterium]
MADDQQLQTLLSRVALADRKAFQQLYDLSSPHLYAAALRILRTPSLAEEAVQDAYVQIWQRAASYRANKAQANTWMNAILRYRALDLLRKHGRESSTEQLAEGDLPITSGEAALSDIQQDLQQCLDELSPDQRRSIALAYVEGYSHSELSVQLDTALGTVKSWIRRGLQQLKECLQR